MLDAERVRINLIAAVAENGVIGQGNAMPWHLPADFAWFKRHTLGHPVLMGRKTFESIGKPLPGRRNIVLTRDPCWTAAGAERAGTLEAALRMCEGAEEIYIIGGGELYVAALPHAQRLLLTTVACRPSGDTRFPEWNPHQWRETLSEAHPADGKNAFAMIFRILEKVVSVG